MAQPIREKFGRVFLRNSRGEYDLLPSAKFSSLTLRWYNFQDEVHPEFSKHIGKPFKISARISSTNKSGVTNNFEARFKYPLGLGENYCADLDYFSKLLQLELDLAKETGIIEKESDKMAEFIKMSEISSSMLFAIPGEEVLKYRTIVLMCLFGSMDSMFDGDKSLKSPQKYFERKQVLDKVITAQMEGQPISLKQLISAFSSGTEDSDDEDIDINEMLATMRRGEKKLKYFTKLRDAITKDMSKEEGRALWTMMAAIGDADSLSKAKEWMEVLSDEKTALKLLPFQGCLHQHSTGVGEVMDCINSLQGIKLKPETRGMLAVKMFQEQLAVTASKLNSLFSYEKELTEEGFHHNEVMMLHTVGKLELEETQQRIVDDINKSVETAQGLKELILKFKEEDDMIEKYVERTMKFLGAGIQWAYYTRRYHDVEAVDCYVDDWE